MTDKKKKDKKCNKKGSMGLGLVMLAVMAIIGFAIVDSITADAVSAASLNQSVGTANATGYFSGVLSYAPLTTPAVYANGTLQTGNYSVAVGSKVITTTNGASNFKGATIKAYYDYDDATYLSGGISRTIIQYIVPIGLLGILGFVALGGGA